MIIFSSKHWDVGMTFELLFLIQIMRHNDLGSYPIHNDVVEFVISSSSYSLKYLCMFYHIPFVNGK